MKTILFKSFVGYLVVTLLVYLSPVPYAYANPVLQNPAPNGGNNIASAGSATVKTSGNTETITQTSGNAVIDWSKFNIGGKETTKFIDPNSSSLTVNRVHDMNASQILGTLSSNGNIVLINPNGVFFGKGSVVDVNGIVATTSNVSNAGVMNGGKLNFTPGGNPNAAVVNQGTITAANAGLVGLVAPNVTNSGVITAKLGTVHLASGDSFTLDLYGDDLMAIQVSDAVNQQLVKNTGTINAAGGTIKLTAAAGRQIVNSLIDVEGELHAPAVAEKGGTIFIYGEGSNAVEGNVAANKGLKAGNSTVLVSGKLDASGKNAGQTGGNIEILGDDIAIQGGSYLDASGATAGGNIKIGGDFHGQGPTPTAAATVVQNNTTVNANALDSGNGGNVAVWSNQNTSFLGLISAKGGPNGGNGGFVETSGHQLLSLTDKNGNNGMVNASAPKGLAGTWLLDPADVTITNADSGGGTAPTYVPDGTQAESTINVANINTALNAGTNVSITTGGDAAAGTGGGSITVASNIAKTSGSDATLTLSAATDIVVNSNISISSTTGKLNTVLDANTAGGGGAIVMNSGSSITSNGGNITLGGGALSGGLPSGAAVGDATNNFGINIHVATLSVGTGALSLIGTGWSAPATNNLEGVDIFASNITATGNGTITINGTGGNTNGNFTQYGYGTIIQGDGGLYSVSTQNGALSVTGTGGTGQYNGYGIMTGTGITLSTNNGNLTVTGSGGPSGGYSNTGIDMGIRMNGGTIQSTGTGTITLQGTGGGGTLGLNYGIELTGSTIKSTSGAVAITGIGGTGSSNDGIISGTSTNTIGGSSETGNITFNADTVSLANFSAQTTGTVTFAPYTASTSIGVAGGAGTLQITSGAGSILANTTAGSITIGASGDTGTTTINTLSTATPMSFLTGNSGSNVVNGALTGTGSAGFTFTGPTSLNAGITTAGGGATFNNAVTLGANDNISTSGGNIAFGSTVDGAYNFTASGGVISLASALGGTTPLSAVSLTSTNSLTLPSISATSLTAQTTAATSDITIASGDALTASGTGTAITLVAGRNFINNAGASALSASNGRWLVYSTNPANDTTGGLSNDFLLFSCTYSGSCPSFPGSGNGFLYSYTPPPTRSVIMVPPTTPVTQPPAPVTPVASNPAPVPVSPVPPAVPEVEPSTVVGVVSVSPSIISNSNTVNTGGGTPSAMSPGGYLAMQTTQQAIANSEPVEIQGPDNLAPDVNTTPSVSAPVKKDNGQTSNTSATPTNYASGNGKQYDPANDNTVMKYDPANDNPDLIGRPRTDNAKPATKAQNEKKARQQNLRDRLQRVARIWRAMRDAQASGRVDSRPDNG